MIRQEGMLVLLKNLQSCANLEVLDLRDNFLHNASLVELSNLITSNTTLKSLNLSDCNIEEEDNPLVISAFEATNVKLSKFGYNYNQLNGENANKLLDAVLKNSNNLTKFDIKGNDFTKQNKAYYK